MGKDETRISMFLPNSIKEELEQMADETKIPSNKLILMAVHSLVKNYQLKGGFIFVDLLNPDTDKKGSRR